MGESNYIFESSNSLYFFTILFACFLSIFVCFYITKLILEYKNKELRKTYLTYIGLLLTFIFMISYGGRSNKKYYQGIKDNLGTTVGIILKRDDDDILFEYHVNGRYFTCASGTTYNGFSIPNIIVPNGKYKVLYNKKNPQMSVMDFKSKYN